MVCRSRTALPGNGTQLLARFMPRSPEPDALLPPGAEIVARENGGLTLRVPRAGTPDLTARLLSALPVIDLSVEDPPIDAVIDQIYQEGAV